MINRLKDFLARGGAWTTIQFLIIASVVGLGQWFPQDWPRALAMTGWAMFGAGVVVFLAGFMVLGRNLSPYTQPRPGGQLVRRGIYTRLRHPLYTGVILAAIGWAVGKTSPAALGVALVLIPFFNAKARAEERWLLKRFPDYAEYARRVPRFLPRLGRKAHLVCDL